MKRITSFLLALCLVLGLAGCKKSAPWQEQYDLGIKYLSEGNYQEAVIAFNAAIEIDPKAAVLYVGRAQAYIGSGETEENLTAALADYEQALELDETDTEAWLGLADVYILQGSYDKLSNFDKAHEVLKEALDKADNPDRIHEMLDPMSEGQYYDSMYHIRCQKYQDYNGENIADSWLFYFYDEEGPLTCTASSDLHGNLRWYHTYTHDENGHENSVTAFDGSGNQIGYLNLAYNEQGQSVVSNEQGELVVSYSYLHTGEIDSKAVTEYDEAGHAIKVSFYDISDGSLSSVHEFDDSGTPIS